VSVGFAEPVGAMIGAAVVLDMIADARAPPQEARPRRVLHQIQYAGVIERVLGDAGIPCHSTRATAHAARVLRAVRAGDHHGAGAVRRDGGASRRDVLRSARTTVPVARAHDLP